MAQINSINELLNALRRRAFLIVMVTVLGCIASLFFALSKPKIYEAVAVVQIETPQIKVDPSNPNMNPGGGGENLLALIEQKLMSRDRLIQVIDKYQLYADAHDMSLATKVATLRESARIASLIDPENRWRSNAQASGLVITVRMTDPLQAADVANEFLANILDEGRERRSGRASRTLKFFESEEARVNADIAKLEREIATFKQENAGSLPSGLEAQRNELALLKEAQLGLEQKLIEMQTNKERLRAEELARQEQLLRQQTALIGERISLINSYLDAAPEVERRMNMLDRSLEQLQEEFKIITSRRADAAMTQAIESRDQFERFEVLETALVPEYPVSASRKKVALAGGIASVLAALGLAIVLEWVSPVLRTSAQVERALGIRPVVSIPMIENRRKRRGRALRWIGAILVALFAALVFLGSQVSRMITSGGVSQRKASAK